MIGAVRACLRNPRSWGRATAWILHVESVESSSDKIRSMKTTVDIPDDELEAVMRHTRATTKREAIVTAIAEFNRRRRMAALVEHAGKGETITTPEELQAQRRRG